MPEEKNDHRTETAKEPYEPPAVISEEVFETLALACAKTNGFQCPGGITS